MVIMNPSDTALTGSAIEAMLPTSIMEDATVYVPLHVGMGLETEQVPVIPEIRIWTDLLDSSMKKHFGSRKSKAVLAPLMKDEDTTVEIWFPNDIPPKPLDRHT